MNKNEILEKSRNENKNMDEMEKTALAQAGNFGAGVGGTMCMLLLTLNAIFDRFDCSLAVWAVYMAITGSTLLFKYIKLRKKHELIFGIIEIVASLCFLGMYLVRLKWTTD